MQITGARVHDQSRPRAALATFRGAWLACAARPHSPGVWTFFHKTRCLRHLELTLRAHKPQHHNRCESTLCLWRATRHKSQAPSGFPSFLWPFCPSSWAWSIRERSTTSGTCLAWVHKGGNPGAVAPSRGPAVMLRRCVPKAACPSAGPNKYQIKRHRLRQPRLPALAARTSTAW